MLVLLDVLLEREQLLLELVAQAGQRVADVVGELLVEHALQVRRAQPVRDVAVRRVAAARRCHYGSPVSCVRLGKTL